MGEPVNQVDVDRMKPGLPQPLHAGAGDLHRLNPVDRLLDLRIVVLHAHRGPVEAGLPKRGDVFAGQPARVDLDAGLTPGGVPEMPMQDRAESPDLVRLEESRRAAAEVHLDHSPVADAFFAKRGHLPVEVIEVVRPFPVLGGDDGRAAAEPAKRFAERDVAVERQVAVGLFVGFDQPVQPVGVVRFGEPRRGRVGGIPRPRHIVFADEIQVDGQFAHWKSLTVLTTASMLSSRASMVTPCPRLKI